MKDGGKEGKRKCTEERASERKWSMIKRESVRCDKRKNEAEEKGRQEKRRQEVLRYAGERQRKDGENEGNHWQAINEAQDIKNLRNEKTY